VPRKQGTGSRWWNLSISISEVKEVAMAVVINEMEVVPASPEAAPSGTNSDLKPKQVADPREVERALLKQIERSARVRAH
jgi:hypothetical protein